MTRIITGRAWMLALVLTIAVAAGPLVWRSGEAAPHASSERLARRLVADIVGGRNAGRALCQLQKLRRDYSRPSYEQEACDAETVKLHAPGPNGAPRWHSAPRALDGDYGRSRSARGFLAAINNSVRAAPEGARRPCSHSCSVRTDTPSSSANRGCDSPVPSRMDATDGKPGVHILRHHADSRIMPMTAMS